MSTSHEAGIYAGELAAPILYPGDRAWDQARTAWNLAVDQRPAAIALPRSREEVASAVRMATRAGLRVSAQGTGHGAAAHDSLADTLLVKTAALKGVRIDEHAQRARVAAGTLWLERSRRRANTGWPRSRGPRPTSAWSATRWAAG